MAQVTSGLVSVEDGAKKAEEYAPPRKVRVELSFSVAEGEDFSEVFDHVSNAASNRVASLLNGSAPIALVAGTDASAPTPPTRTRRTKAQIAADAEAAAKAAGTAANPPANAPKATGEELPDDPTGGEDHVIHLDDKSDELPDDGEELPADDDEFTVQPEDEPEDEAITDADLNSAVQKKNGELAAPELIRKLISTYNPDPKQVFQLRQIPAAKRAEFLKKLAGLKKAG